MSKPEVNKERGLLDGWMERPSIQFLCVIQSTCSFYLELLRVKNVSRHIHRNYQEIMSAIRAIKLDGLIHKNKYYSLCIGLYINKNVNIVSTQDHYGSPVCTNQTDAHCQKYNCKMLFGG